MSTSIMCYSAYVLGACIGLIFGAETTAFYILMGVLAFDTITGVAKSVRFKRFKSGDAIRGMVSKIFMVGLVLLFAIVSQAKFPDNTRPIHLSSGFIWFLIIAETISIVQNTIMVKTGKEIEEWDAVTFLYNQILDKLRKVLQAIK